MDTRRNTPRLPIEIDRLKALVLTIPSSVRKNRQKRRHDYPKSLTGRVLMFTKVRRENQLLLYLSEHRVKSRQSELHLYGIGSSPIVLRCVGLMHRLFRLQKGLFPTNKCFIHFRWVYVHWSKRQSLSLLDNNCQANITFAINIIAIIGLGRCRTAPITLISTWSSCNPWKP